MNGEVLESFPGAQFSVKLENGHSLRCVISGKLRKNNIKIIPGDTVVVELSPYDINLGRIVYRRN